MVVTIPTGVTIPSRSYDRVSNWLNLRKSRSDLGPPRVLRDMLADSATVRTMTQCRIAERRINGTDGIAWRKKKGGGWPSGGRTGHGLVLVVDVLGIRRDIEQAGDDLIVEGHARRDDVDERELRAVGRAQRVGKPVPSQRPTARKTPLTWCSCAIGSVNAAKSHRWHDRRQSRASAAVSTCLADSFKW